MECLIVIDGKNYSFKRIYSHPSKNEGWVTLLSRLGLRDQRLDHRPKNSEPKIKFKDLVNNHPARAMMVYLMQYPASKHCIHEKVEDLL